MRSLQTARLPPISWRVSRMPRKNRSAQRSRFQQMLRINALSVISDRTEVAGRTRGYFIRFRCACLLAGLAQCFSCDSGRLHLGAWDVILRGGSSTLRVGNSVAIGCFAGREC